MKNTFIICTFALFLVSCGGRSRQAASDGAVLPALSHHVIELNTSRVLTGRDTIELGRLKAGEVIEYQLGVRNSDSTAMVILDVNTTCGCAMLDYDTAPIVPGDTAMLSLQYDSRGQSGSQLKLIRLTTSFGPRPYSILLHADVQP